MAYVQPHVPKPPPEFSPEYPRTRALRAARDLIHEGYPPVFVFEVLQSVHPIRRRSRAEVYLLAKLEMDLRLDEKALLWPDRMLE